MPFFINYNGRIVGEDTPLVTAGNRGLRYGDGIFETMKLIQGEIRLEIYHFERLFQSLDSLQFVRPPGFTAEFLKNQIQLLAARNGVSDAARVRVNVFRKNGGLYDLSDYTPEFVIEALPLPPNYLELNDAGLAIDVYPEARKSRDRFSGIKSNNYLPYMMGALFARQKNLDDALILNDANRVCDTTISNVFWIRDKTIFTPPLTEGCIAGVMRRHLSTLLPHHGLHIMDQPLAVDELHAAEEVFLTNALFGMRWVRTFGTSTYTNQFSRSIYPLLA